MKRLAWIPIVTAFVAVPAAAQDDVDVLGFLDSRYEQTADVARSLWEFAEVGYQETRSSRLLQAELAQAGFEIEDGVAGIPTAFIASYGSGEPVVAILAEYDALPGINQDAVPMRSPIAGKQAGRSEELV